jgi:hypothetical protein
VSCDGVLRGYGGSCTTPDAPHYLGPRDPFLPKCTEEPVWAQSSSGQFNHSSIISNSLKILIFVNPRDWVNGLVLWEQLRPLRA